MSPEQAAGRTGDVGPLSDIYGLGAVLYELLTGRPPFQGETALVTLRHVLEDGPVPPRQMGPEVPRDLDVICLRCLQKEPRHRYPTAQDLADDLGRYLNGEPILARPVLAPVRLARWCRRRPTIAGLVGGLIVSLLAGAAVAAFFAVQAEARARDATERLWRSHLAAARALQGTGRVGQRIDGLAALAAAAAIRPGPELRDQAIACLTRLDIKPRRTWTVDLPWAGLADPTLTNYACGDDRGTTWVRRVMDDRELARLANPDGRPCAHLFHFSADGLFLAAWHDAWRGLPPECRVWDIARGRVTVQTPAVSWYAHPFAPWGPEIAVVAPDGTIRVFDPRTGQALAAIAWDPALGSVPTVLKYHPSRRLVAALVRERTALHVIDLEAREVVRSFTMPAPAFDCAWHPREDGIVIGFGDGTVRLLSAATGETRATWSGHQAEAIGVSFSPDGRLLASRSWDASGRLWEVASGRPLLRLDGDCVALEFSSSGHELMTRTRRGELAVLEIIDGRAYQSFAHSSTGTKGPAALCFSPDGRWLATADDSAVRIWDATSFQQRAHLPLEKTTSVQFSPRDQGLFTLSDGVARRWPVVPRPEPDAIEVGLPEVINPTPATRYLGSTLSANGGSLAVFHADGRIEHVFLDAPTRSVVLKDRFDPNARLIGGDGRHFAVLSDGARSLTIWDAHTGVRVRDLSQHLTGIQDVDYRAAIVFSPDGRWLLACSSRAYLLWSTSSWTSPLHIVRPDTDRAGPAVFSPDGQVLALADSRLEVRLVCPATGRTLARLGPPYPIHVDALAFSADGSRLAMGGGNLVRVWDLAAIRAQLASLGLDLEEAPADQADSASP